MPVKLLTFLLILAILLCFSGRTASGLTPGPGEDPEIPHTLRDFSDLDAGAWYAPSVAFLYRHEVFRGTSPTTFDPDVPMTRAMLAVALYRHAGAPELPAPHSFPDVEPGAWYADGAAWVWESGLLDCGETFDPHSPVTLGDCLNALCRYAGALGAADVPAWAEACGLLNGLPGGPDAVLTRGEAAVLLERFSQLFVAAP